MEIETPSQICALLENPVFVRGKILNNLPKCVSDIWLDHIVAGSIIDWSNETEIFRNLVCISVLGIEDPIRPEVRSVWNSNRWSYIVFFLKY